MARQPAGFPVSGHPLVLLARARHCPAGAASSFEDGLVTLLEVLAQLGL